MKTDDNISNINGGCFNSDVLLKYIKGELSGFEMNRVERHLATCEMCRDELEGLSLLKDPDEINSIRIVLNSRVDRVVEEEKEGISAWGLYFRIAASIVLLIGASTLIYISAFRNTQSVSMSHNEMFDIAIPEALMESSPPYEEKELASNAPNENPKMAYSGTAGKSSKINNPEKERINEAIKYVAPVVVDSLANNIAKMEVISEDKLEVADSEMLSKNEAFASGQVAVNANAPAKAESIGKNAFFSREGLSKKDIVSGGVNDNNSTVLSNSAMKVAAITQYSRGNYSNVLLILNKLGLEYKGNDTIQFYTSMSYYHLNSNDISILGLKLLSQNPKSGYFNDAQWYYALNLLRNGYTQQADSVLRSIIDVNPKYKVEAIRKLEEFKR